jgi:UDP-glucose 4-epimerase
VVEVRRRGSGYEAEYGRRGWRIFLSIGRVYLNQRARDELGWRTRYDFQFILDRLATGNDPTSPLARAIGSKRYHADAWRDRPCPVE